jgi:hypothetical protein
MARLLSRQAMKNGMRAWVAILVTPGLSFMGPSFRKCLHLGAKFGNLLLLFANCFNEGRGEATIIDAKHSFGVCVDDFGENFLDVLGQDAKVFALRAIWIRPAKLDTPDAQEFVEGTTERANLLLQAFVGKVRNFCILKRRGSFDDDVTIRDGNTVDVCLAEHEHVVRIIVVANDEFRGLAGIIAEIPNIG